MKNEVKEELKQFKKFKQDYEFNQKVLEERDGILYCDGESLVNEDGRELGETDKWINVGYKLKGAYAKALSNLFPYEFEFKGKKLHSIEAFFQGIKFINIDMQNLVLEYSGMDSNSIKVASDYDWKENGIIYWQGNPIKRDSKEYDDIIDELYISAIQNPLYRSVLKNCNKDIIHTMGADSKEETVFTRYEFEKQLNCIKDFLNKGDN